MSDKPANIDAARARKAAKIASDRGLGALADLMHRGARFIEKDEDELTDDDWRNMEAAGAKVDAQPEADDDEQPQEP